MTPAEHARLIERQELEAERTAIRERALRLVEQRRQEDRRKVENWIGKPQPAPSSRAPSCSKPAKRYMLNGEAKTMTELSQIADVSLKTMSRRLRSGMSVEHAANMELWERPTELHTVNGVSKTLKQWADHIGISYHALLTRKRRKGFSLAEAIAMPTGRHPKQHLPGVSSDFEGFEGTGAGSTAQEIPEITFSEQAENR